MAIFKYNGVNSSGKELTSTITAETLAQAKNKLKNQGIILVSIKEQKSDSQKKSSIKLLQPISVNDLALMTRQLATLLKARIQVVDALTALVDQSDNRDLKVILAEVGQKVNEGSSLAKALSDYPNVFNNIYVNMVEAGESSGTLHIVLLRLSEFTEAQVKLRNKVSGAMTYPIIMVAFGTIMMVIIFTLVIPKITKIFVSMKKTLPLPTRISIFLSDIFLNYWWAILIVLVVSFYSFRKYITTESGQKRWHRFLLRLPVIKGLIIMINVSRFCSTLATLLQSGVPILTSIKIVQNLVSNVHMKQAVAEARMAVAEGASMTGPLAKSNLFPTMVTHMIKLGESSGELEPMLEIISENYSDQVDAKLNGLTSILQPIMLVAMGLAVTFIVFSVIMPMMELNSFR
ncbi:MAG: hypothetical protein A2381_11840 [Bdellovibrionales bacterium RIFOXYB1_FULL_37_110]|nr:MAG: hypothetical protein A2181_05905 [Bdellovibrionales bacterium RIFOXYA1_FULL_38_20]OFZ49247.1 MAG: hypothetical protein A2417_17080 [Bdellovibrionales bacterium RIFOXYC1_FULL_37_79]OFZ58495.1 MAG: hypothetical protein A2381_11840 [Bdellovibrionales bacterium RIFOXYB1_FULL_37_110]OFZ61508.1 MAG: hypothetical protein A2577_00360 [Bdellovibrionales bacterium RIFOXYD1_FULL_36_51]